MSAGEEKLGIFLRDVSSWLWIDFVKAENDEENYTSNEAMIFALVRAAAMQKMDAIRLSLNRLDGKLKTPIKIETPRVTYIYPWATEIEGGEKEEVPVTALLTVSGEDYQPSSAKKPNSTDNIAQPTNLVQYSEDGAIHNDLPSMSLREALTEMANYQRSLPATIIRLAMETEQALLGHGPMPKEIPMVKSVIAAHLLTMAQNRDISAISEVFDQIDGKLVETIQIIGEDIVIKEFATVAPRGAVKNKDGIYEIEATKSMEIWAAKLGGQQLL